MIWFLFVLTSLASAAPQPGRIGDLAYDEKRWEVVKLADVHRVLSRGPEGEKHDVMSVRIAPGPASACSAAALLEETQGRYDREPQVLKRPGFDIQLVTAWTGCRNWTPPIVEACAAYNGQVYRFHAPAFGCRGGPHMGSAGMDFLEHLRVP